MNARTCGWMDGRDKPDHDTPAARATMPPLHIAIAGAGTAGLAAAAFLAREGHRITLFERFAEPRPVGAGLMIQPTGLACLAMLGLDRAAIDQGEVIARLYGDTISGTRI